jgi:hypothetical protein
LRSALAEQRGPSQARGEPGADRSSIPCFRVRRVRICIDPLAERTPLRANYLFFTSLDAANSQRLPSSRLSKGRQTSEFGKRIGLAFE